MSTAPSGWQNPKTNWASADVPLPTDFNRIESNLQAIELGQRTLDPTQAPTGNTGSLRQLLDWLANRLKAITGTTNWYDTPPRTLADLDAHIKRTDNPHGVTKQQVGLGNVQNYDVASQAEAEAGTANDKYMTPLRVKQAISVLGTKVASGTYTGNNQSSRTITVGFTPKLVIVMGLYYKGTGMDDENRYGGLVMIPNGTLVHFGSSNVSTTYGAIVTNGFRVSISNGFGLNHNNYQYAWVAVG